MDLTSRARRIIIAVALGTALAVPAAVISVSAASAAPRSGAERSATPECRSPNNVIVWLGLNPDGAAAGTTFYPLEFSNVGVGTHACWISGSPTVWAVTASHGKLGPKAGSGGSGRKITLQPGQTAHALLGIVQKGFIAGCQNATAAGLEVSLPGSSALQPIDSFTFPVCKNKVFMRVQPVASGLSIP
ncbi:MAG TPA: DUF4232 domain-containing protein [Streptosporangiaceae bacterium]|nr:DUF4232 domain-containing protein [Streptosporangiaceae bacterium]